VRSIGKRATIKDVARAAGVSTATVSFVLNDNPKESISPEVRRRVLKVAQSLSYHASAAAAGLARKRIRNVGIVFYKQDDAIVNPFYGFVVQGALKEAIEREYNLLFSYVDSTYKSYSDLPKIVREKNVAGVIFMRRLEPRMVRDIVTLGVAVVAVDTFPRVDGINSLQMDNHRGGLLAGEHLIDLGHEHLAMLFPRRPPPSVADRLAGFRDAFDRRDRKFSRGAHVVDAAALTFQAGYEATRAALARKGDLSALFCGNDEMAAGALRAVHESGRNIPRDFSLVGFDDIMMSAYTDPPLTTISVVKEHMGRRAMARLIELVEGIDQRAKLELAPVDLIQRGSTGRARPRRGAAR
jgi:DNA-binding LacI/PurR family transcriptional regulator